LLTSSRALLTSCRWSWMTASAPSNMQLPGRPGPGAIAKSARTCHVRGGAAMLSARTATVRASHRRRLDVAGCPHHQDFAIALESARSGGTGHPVGRMLMGRRRSLRPESACRA
jgi:hypothetical protein